MSQNEIRLGVVGCGGFGLFALQHFTQVPGVKLVGMAGTHRPAAQAAAQRFEIAEIESVEALVSRSDLDMVYIATPPFLHHEQAMLALRAGKHVLCEKPLARTLREADEMIELAGQQGLLLAANLMQRYNPLFEAVERLVQSKVLGEALHGYFENYAADEGLSAEHWFWDRTKSGGIFIEHGVHFFDLFSGWFGGGEVIAAQRVLRPGTALEDQVLCTASYANGALVNFYHGFHQPGRLDRQEMRIVFERGDISLYEWVPTRVRLHAIANEDQTRTLCEIFPGARLDVAEIYSADQRACHGRHKALDAYQKLELHYGDEQQKMVRYGQLLRSLFADQLAWIRDQSHRRRVSEKNGRDSLAMAEQADQLAQ